MLRKKIIHISILDYAIDTIYSFSRCLFSKAQEDEADEYAFNLLIEKGYDPFAVSSVFAKLSELTSHSHNLLIDFFSTHPYEVLRRDKFHSQAERWIANHPEIKMYVGKRNFEEKRSRYDLSYSDEYKLPRISVH